MKIRKIHKARLEMTKKEWRLKTRIMTECFRLFKKKTVHRSWRGVNCKNCLEKK